MALTRALAGDGEQISKTELTVTSALNQTVSVFLPIIDNGTLGDVAGTVIGFEANGNGQILVKDNYGHLIARVQSGDRVEVFATATQWRLATAQTHRLEVRTEDKLVNGAVAAVLTGNGPTGMGAAVVGWLSFATLPDGTVAKIPYWV